MTRQIVGVSIPKMSGTRYSPSSIALVIIALLVGCGGGGSMPSAPPPLDMTITPAAATIMLYSSVNLGLKGFVSGANVNWSVEKDFSCTVDDFYANPPCPDGWLYQLFPNVTYNAPVTPGTYNVYANWYLFHLQAPRRDNLWQLSRLLGSIPV
jgi:hypothetical protein